MVHFPYCDGASFSGHREQPFHNLTFRGMQNLDGALDLLLSSFGLASATEVLVTGSSVGGLATFLHTDHVRDRITSHAPQSKVVAVPVVGYFLDTGPTSHWGKSLQSLVDVHNVTTESGLNKLRLALQTGRKIGHGRVFSHPICSGTSAHRSLCSTHASTSGSSTTSRRSRASNEVLRKTAITLNSNA